MDPSVRHDDARFLDLLQRWQDGDFTRSDERELHALATSDDFRRETLEGFMSQPEAEHGARLAALRARLKVQSGGGRNLVSMPQIWAVAAALVLLVAAFWFFPRTANRNTAPVAQTEIPAVAPDTNSGLAAAPENADGGPNDRISATAPAASREAGPAADKQTTPASGNASADIAVADEAKAVESAPAPTLAAPPPAAAAKPRPADDVAFQQAPGAGASESESAPGGRVQEAAKAKKLPGRNRTADSVWHETDRKPDMEAIKKDALGRNQPVQSEPEGGWEAFAEYIRQNARLTPDARNNNVSGTVRLQFSISVNGDPQGFVVLRSVPYGCDQEAIRLVQGWEWRRGDNAVLTVEIPFVR